jgi:hypothetical protein
MNKRNINVANADYNYEVLKEKLFFMLFGALLFIFYPWPFLNF